MRRIAGLVAFAIFLLVSAIPSQSRAEDINLSVGGQRTLTLSARILRIVIGEAGIIDAVALDEFNLRITGLQPGRTSLAVFTADGDDGSSYIVTVGDVAPTREPVVEEPPRVNVAALLRSQPGMGGVRVRTEGDTVVLSGTVPDLETHVRAMEVARSYGGEVTDLIDVTGNQMVAVDIRFAAVSATTLKQLGFNFAALGGDIQGALTSPSTVSSFTFDDAAGLALDTVLPLQSAFNVFLADPRNGILGILSALQEAGLTQLLAQPTLMVRSGDSASFLAGGEVPIPVPQGGAAAGTITIEYHPYGVRLDISPVVLSDRRIVLQVSPEVSELDFENALTIQGFNVPAFRRRSTTTTVELGDGQSFVLAGLLYSSSRVNESKFPWLGDLPIIGMFFKTTQNQQERQELIIVATPRLVSPLAPGQIPPLPGVDRDGPFDPSIGDAILNRNTVEQELAPYGLMK